MLENSCCPICLNDDVVTHFYSCDKYMICQMCWFTLCDLGMDSCDKCSICVNECSYMGYIND